MTPGARTHVRALMTAIVCPLMVALNAVPAAARLPAPTAEEQAALDAKAAREKAQLEAEREALGRAQDRVAARYGRGASREAVPPSTDLPKTAIELPRDAGPHGRREPSAEAHSAPAR